IDSKTPRTDSPATLSAGGSIRRKDCSGAIISSGNRSWCHASLRYGYTFSSSVARNSSSAVVSADVRCCEKPYTSQAGVRLMLRHQPCLARSEEHTSELQSRFDLVCRLLHEKKKIYNELNQKKEKHHYAY